MLASFIWSGIISIAVAVVPRFSCYMEYSHPKYDIFELLALFPLDLGCLYIQCLVKDENDALQLESILDLERLH